VTTILPRKNEVEAVLSILESDEYDDAVSMAKQIVKALGAELGRRETFAVTRGLASDDLRVAFGPYYSQGQALKVAGAARGIGLVAHVVKVNPADEAVPTDVESVGKRCKCSHPKELHGSSITPRAMTTLGCCVFKNKVKCDCKGYQAE
jgi:hypothetical protein